jgi:hypothetical protein
MFESLKNLLWKDFSETKATDFEDMICSILNNEWHVYRQQWVKDRGDWCSGRIDLVFYKNWLSYAIEIDRNSPREKSIFKLKQYDCEKRFIFTRCPFTIIEI